MYRVNLLPPELVFESERSQRRARPLGLLIMLGTIGCLVYTAFVFWFFLSRAQLEEKRQALAALEPQIQQVEALQNRAVMLRARTAAWQEVLAERRTHHPVLTDLQRFLPADMWLTRVEIARPEPQVSGSASQQGAVENQQAQAPPPPAFPRPTRVVIEGGTGSLASVGVYINKLCRLPYFTNVALKEVREIKTAGQPGATVFTIEAGLKEGGGR
ncbi:MAG: PilN domain-containing protein [Bacillota bacterium]|jgi:Tfp pilus assembly protein PilN|nr:PilN domain-containing protein [Thermoanaerobacteraceae bacterium]